MSNSNGNRSESKYDYYDTFDYVVYDRFADQICKTCWRLVRGGLEAPSDGWRRAREDRLGKAVDLDPREGETMAYPRGEESTKAIMGTRPAIAENTVRSEDMAWCECGSSLKDLHDWARVDDISFENGAQYVPEPLNARLGDVVNTHFVLVDRSISLAENFARTYQRLRRSYPDENLPRINPGLFKHLVMIRLNPFGEDSRVNHALRASFGAAVVADLKTYLWTCSVCREIADRCETLAERSEAIHELFAACDRCDSVGSCDDCLSEATDELTRLAETLASDPIPATGPP